MIGEASRQHDVYKMREITCDASSFIAQSVECYRSWCFGDECPNALRTTSADENLDVNRVKNWRSESASADGLGFFLEKDEDWSKEVQVAEALLGKTIEEDVILLVYERMPDEPVDRALTWRTIVRAVAWMTQVAINWRRGLPDQWVAWKFRSPDMHHWGAASRIG
jgi:hypothetical protein